jgi:2-dehydro-3-deoxygluconokinase
VLIANEEQAAQILGATISASSADRFSQARYVDQLAALRAKYDLSHVIFTIRAGDTADRTSIAAVIEDGNSAEMSRRYDIQVVDRVGGGDALAGGLIYGLLNHWDAKKTVEFAAAASALKHTVPWDFAHLTLAEVLGLIEHGPSGRVER